MGANAKSTSKKDSSGGPHPFFLSFIFSIFRGIGLAIALAIFLQGNTAAYEEKIAIVAQLDLGWMYLGLFLINLATLVLFILNQRFRHLLSFPRPDQQLLKVVTDWKKPADKAIGFAVLEDEGLAGAFNRSGRAAFNFLEYVPCLVAFVLAAGFVFPFPTFVLCGLQVLGRSVYSIGYASGVSGRIPGFMLSTLTMIVLEMMVLFIGLRSLGFFPYV